MGLALRLLVDTSVLIWATSTPSKLSNRARDALDEQDNAVYVSAASAWEIATKHRLGRLEQAAPLVADWSGHMAHAQYGQIAMTETHALRAGSYELEHGDPFDRVIAAQAELEGLTVVSSDRAFDLFPVNRLW